MTLFSNFLNFFPIFWNFLLRVWWEPIRMISFIFSLSWLFATYLGLKRSHNIFFLFFEFFCYFHGIFFFESGRNTSEGFFFYFLSFSAFAILFCLKRSYDGVSNFLNFFAIFLEFSITGWVGTDQNHFFFLSFSVFPNLFWLEMKL